MIEPIQGEGGVRLVPPAFLRGLREICDRHGLLLIFDEVQTGVGRTGSSSPMSIAACSPTFSRPPKASAAAFRCRACLATADAARGLTAGVHGTTFGGNPLAMAVGNAVLDVVLAPGFLERVARLGLDMRQRLAELEDAHRAVIEEVRGEGLMIGLKLESRRPISPKRRASRGCSSFPPATTSCGLCRR